MLTGEEQKEVCRVAMRTIANNYDLDRSQARCYVANQIIADSDILLGMYDVTGIAVLNFDEKGKTITPGRVVSLSKSASATASGK